MTYRTPTRQLIEACEIVKDTNKLKLLGCEALCNCGNREISILARKKHINCERNSFSKQLEVGDEFHYLIEVQKNGSTKSAEMGLGYLSKEGDNFYVNRMLPLAHVDESGQFIDATGTLNTFIDAEGEGLDYILTNYTPSNVKEFFFRDSSLMTAHAPFIPHSINIEKDSIVGRDGLKQLDNMPLKDLHNNTNFSYSVIQSLVKEAKQLVLKTSQIDVKKLKTGQLLLKPSTKAVQQEGAIYYNSQDKKIQVYDGEKWRNLSYEDT